MSLWHLEPLQTPVVHSHLEHQLNPVNLQVLSPLEPLYDLVLPWDQLVQCSLLHLGPLLHLELLYYLEDLYHLWHLEVLLPLLVPELLWDQLHLERLEVL